jgi:CheY-like chemotaxis protein
VTPEQPANPSLAQLQARGQDLVAQLGALHSAMVAELTDHQTRLKRAEAERKALLDKHAAESKEFQDRLVQLGAQREGLQKQVDGLLAAQQQWAVERKGLLEKHAAETKQLGERLAALAKDNEGLQTDQLQWAVERERQLKEHEQQLKEHEGLKALHSQVADQAKKLGDDWAARRQALTTETQQVRAELEQTQKTLALSQQREKQWQGQVLKLQDELHNLRDATGRMTLTDEQSHHLLSQLNAIIGFAEVLLDEAGSRATAEERQEFLHDIKESGDHLADYVQQLTVVAPEDTPAASETAAAPPVPAQQWVAKSILVAATDEAVRERCQTFLGRAGYQVEFASDADEAVAMAVRLQPLAIMVDSELSPKGGEALVDLIAGEPRARDIPVVVTGRNDQEPLGLMTGRYDFLTKPINRQQMLQMMVKFELLADRRRASKMPASVLVIDDDARNTRLVKAMLKPHNVNVLEADGGPAGIKLAIKHKPDLIVLDLMMPDVDGFQVVSALRKDPVTNQIPILIYTAKNITVEDRRQLRDSIQSIVRKGELSKEQFLELIYKRGERRNRPAETEKAA